MEPVTSRQFHGTTVRFYLIDGQLWIRRHELGEALKYACPGRSASKLHSRYKNSFVEHSRKEILKNKNGENQETILYDLVAVGIFCVISEKKLSKEFCIWIQKAASSTQNNLKLQPA